MKKIHQPMNKNLTYTPFYVMPILVGGLSVIRGYFFKRVLVQNYLPEPTDFKGLNNSEVMFTASVLKSDSNVLHLTTIDRDIFLKGRGTDTPNGWGYLVIGS